MNPLSAELRQNSSQYGNGSVVVGIVLDGVDGVVVDVVVVVVDVDGPVDVVEVIDVDGAVAVVVVVDVDVVDVVEDVDVELSGIPCLQQLSVVLQMSSAMQPPIE